MVLLHEMYLVVQGIELPVNFSDAKPRCDARLDLILSEDDHISYM